MLSTTHKFNLAIKAYCKGITGCFFVIKLHSINIQVMALNTTCSKAFLGTHVPKSALHVSYTPKFSLSQNDKNLLFPTLVLNKGLFPLHAMPSKTMMDLDTLVIQPEEQEQQEETKTINVKFQLQRNCNYGEQFLVVGNDPIFGSWNPANAIPMTWSEGHVWTTEMGVPAGNFQFKIILKRKEGEIVWQPGPDRILQTWDAMNRITVCEDWENAEHQKVTEDDDDDDGVPNTEEEDQLDNPNMEIHIESEMPNLDSSKEKQKSNVSKMMKSTC